jgi:hypothetical protein
VVGNDCFAGCRSLATVTFEQGSRLATVGKNAFANCPSISAIRIPPPLERILSEYEPVLEIVRPVLWALKKRDIGQKTV